MAGGLPSFDDGKVLPGETLWRLIDPSWYQVIDPQVGPEVLDAAFKGGGVIVARIDGVGLHRRYGTKRQV